MTHYPGLTDNWVSEMASHSYSCVGALKKKQSVRFHIECNSLALVFWGHKRECSEALHAQMWSRVLIFGNDSFNLKIRLMNKTVMVTICMCGWGMLGQTGKRAMYLTPEWEVSAASGSPSSLACCDLVPLLVCCGVLFLRPHSISHEMCCELDVAADFFQGRRKQNQLLNPKSCTLKSPCLHL